MPESYSFSSVPPKFPAPGRPPGMNANPVLCLPRRSRTGSRILRSLYDSPEEHREIQQEVSWSRSPFDQAGDEVRSREVRGLQRSLEQIEARLAERERLLTEMELRLAERARDVAEGETLLKARRKLIRANVKNTSAQAPLSQEEQTAITQFKQALDRQETQLRADKEAVREREAFLEKSETMLFAKMQSLQEKETELEQREEEIRKQEHRCRELEAQTDPVVAAQLAAEKSRPFNEFSE